MQVSIETTSGLERRLTVGVPADRVDGAVDQRLREAARNVRLPGFRPGKVPMRVMKQRFGAGVRQEVLGEVISQSFQEAVQAENLRPAGQPTIEPKSLDAGKDLEFTAIFEIFPIITINELAGFEVKKPVADVTDADVDEIIGIFRKQQGSLEVVDRAAEDGDTVTIDFIGTRDDEEFDGGSGEDLALELGSGRMIPGFEEGIVGMSAGDEKTLDLTFPMITRKKNCRPHRYSSRSRLNRWRPLSWPPLTVHCSKVMALPRAESQYFALKSKKIWSVSCEMRSKITSNNRSWMPLWRHTQSWMFHRR